MPIFHRYNTTKSNVDKVLSKFISLTDAWFKVLMFLKEIKNIDLELGESNRADYKIDIWIASRYSSKKHRDEPKRACNCYISKLHGEVKTDEIVMVEEKKSLKEKEV